MKQKWRSTKEEWIFLPIKRTSCATFLNSILEAEDTKVTISPAVVTSFMHKIILWKNELTPSRLAASVLSSVDILHSNALHKESMLNYLTKHEMTAESLEKLTRTQAMFLNDVHTLIKRVQTLYELVKLFLVRNIFWNKGYMD